MKNLVINFSWIWSQIKVCSISCILALIPYMGKIWFLRFGPKCSQPIRLQGFKISISQEQNDEKAWFFACWYRFMESWLKNIGVGMVKNGFSHSVLRALKLAVCQVELNGINWFLVCWYESRKSKIYFNNFLVVVLKNGHGLLDLRILKYAVSQ